MKAIFNGPMSTIECEKSRGINIWRQNGNEENNFNRCFALFRACTGQLGHMRHARPIRLQVRAEFLAHVNDSTLNASSMSIKRFGLLTTGMGIGKIRGDISLQCWFIPFDDKEWIGMMSAQRIPELTMGVERIKGTDPTMNGQGRKQCACLRDLVGFFSHCQLGPNFLTLVRETGKQVRRFSFFCSCSSHGFAIDSEWISGRSETGRPNPRSEYLLNGLDIYLR
jgi:hypothetical protein